MRTTRLYAAVFLVAGLWAFSLRAESKPTPADLVIINAKVLTLDSNSLVAQAMAVRGNRIVAIGRTRAIEKFEGPTTQIINARGQVVMPGLCDANVQSFKAAVSELDGAKPDIASIEDLQKFIRQQVPKTLKTNWIVIRNVYPTHLKEHRYPTLPELDAATTNFPVLLDFGPAVVVNSKALEVAGITRLTSDPRDGEIVRDPVTLQPTGLLRNARQLLPVTTVTPQLPPATRCLAELKGIYTIYNRQGITSIHESGATPLSIDLFRQLRESGDLTVRIQCDRTIHLGTNLQDSVERLSALVTNRPGVEAYGPTGVGDEWVRIGSLELTLDGDLSSATSYLRTPWGISSDLRISEPAYRGLLAVDPVVLRGVYREAAKRNWQVAGHAVGDAAADEALNATQYARFATNEAPKHFVLADSALLPARAWSRFADNDVLVEVEPAQIYQDGGATLKLLGARRCAQLLPLKSCFEHGLIVGAGSGHSGGLDSLAGNQTWSPWFGIWAALTRQTAEGTNLSPEECLTREEALRLYTINNAILSHQESTQGTLETGKFADLIIVDRDVMTCPTDDIKDTQVMLTMVDGKVVWQVKDAALAQAGTEARN